MVVGIEDTLRLVRGLLDLTDAQLDALQSSVGHSVFPKRASTLALFKHPKAKVAEVF